MSDVYRTVLFEFDDPAAMELQPRDEHDKSGFSRDLFGADSTVRTVSCSRMHRHEGSRTVAQFHYAWSGAEELLTEEMAITRAAVHLHTWMAEQTGETPELARVELGFTELGTGNIELVRKDMTEEARVLIAQLAVFSELEPEDLA